MFALPVARESWSLPMSDALLFGEYYNCCPACGNKSLRQEALNPFFEYGGKLLGKLFKR
jgi:hypothetical protein